MTRDDFVRYLHGYAQKFDIHPEFGVDVSRLDRTESGWQLATSAGTRDAWAVVVATGYSLVPQLPAWPGLISMEAS